MKSILGRLMALAGGAIISYSLFLPAIIMEFPLPEQNVGGVIVNFDMQVESSLYQLGDKLKDLENASLPKILDYLWLIFLILALVNILLTLKPRVFFLIRILLGILPITLLIVVVQQTATNPDLAIGYSQLFDYLVNGFYVLAGGAMLVFLGSLLITGKKITPVK